MSIRKSSHPDFSSPLSAGKFLVWFIATLYLKFLVFDLIWAFNTTFSGFQFWQGWLSKLMFATILALPVFLLRSRWYVGAICFIVDAWLVANLMYFRSYYTVIPASSYLLAGNLADFQASVWESVRWVDLVFPAITVALLIRLRTTRIASVLRPVARKMFLRCVAAILVPAAILSIYIAIKGGYKAAYEDLLYDYSTCGAAVYTIPGTWVYEQVAGETELTPELEAKIQTWLDSRPALDSDSIPYAIEARDNCIIILAESFESWLIGTSVDGIELTPNLNRFLAEDNVLYAPNMLSQVRGARSIDAQLILHTGLLPVSYGAYSYRFPHHTYMSLDKAFREKHPDGTTMSFTVDKKVVWNAAIVAQDFGYDRLLDKPFFELDVKTGPRGRLGDHSFLRQSAEKIETEELWPTGGHTLLQCVTYSGHTPFVIPDELKDIHITGDYPERLRNYMEVANYTDRAIGEFIDRLRANPKFDNTMIVITGDHEGIGIARKDYLKDEKLAEFLSPHQFTPFIVLNSPVEMRYDGVLGQADMYPTLLDLLGLDSYPWKGVGQSILDPAKRPFAVSPQGDTAGCTEGVSPQQLDHAKQAYEISDLMISCDYFKTHGR